jgi:arylformamidase
MIFLSHFLSNSTPGYGGSTTDVRIQKNSCMDHGDSSNSLRIDFKNHVGTHVDLPNHFDPNGKVLNDYPADFWEFRRIQLLELPCDNGKIISADDFAGKIDRETECLLLRTGFEAKRGTDDYWARNPGVGSDVGPYLRKNFPGLRIIGFDFISLTSYTNRPLGREAHRGMLGPLDGTEPVLILEDMKLSPLSGAPARIVVAPLLVERADGGPVTVIAYP